MATLRLKTERLAELTTDDLHRVAGAGPVTVKDLCISLLGGCPSVQVCTTAISCGCPPSSDCTNPSERSPLMRTLSLRTERLAELTTDELHRVAGAAAEAAPTWPLRDCVATLHGCTTAITCPKPDDASDTCDLRVYCPGPLRVYTKT